MSDLETAAALHRRGELAAAERLYRAILEREPDHFQALQLLGALAAQRGDHAQAVELIGRALALDPRHAAAQNNLGSSLRALGRHAEALDCFDRAIALRPAHAASFLLRAAALRDLGRQEEAVASYDAALGVQPDYRDALIERGNVLHALGRYNEALESYERVLAGGADADALTNRGAALHALRRHADALECLDRALGMNPGLPAALNNRGNVLQDLRRFGEAIESYERALALDPAYADAWHNRGNALRAVRRREEAAASYARVLAIAPAYPFAKGNLLFARMGSCDWRGFDALVDDVEKDILAGRRGTGPFEYQAVARSARLQRACAEIYATATLPPRVGQPLALPRRAEGRIGLGYVAGEFRQHATSQLIVELLERHDRARFEVYAFDNGWDDGSALRRRIERAVTEVVDISALSDDSAAAAVTQRAIDILVDLNGYCGRGRLGLFARRPAPIQASYLGYSGTLGAGIVDYLLADRHVIRPGEEGFYTEEIVFLPGAYQVSDATRTVPPRPTRAAAGLPESAFVFCCFNNNYKITPQVFAVWMRLLAGAPGSVLWLLEDNAPAARNLRREAQSRGIAAERLVFAPRLEHEPHLARIALADLFLDTAPLNAHTTASDALWCGVPVVTCSGGTFGGRVAGSLLHALGLPELVKQDLGEYEALAGDLAASPARLEQITAKLARNRETQPLFDTERTCRAIEWAFAAMREARLRGAPPRSFAVPG